MNTKMCIYIIACVPTLALFQNCSPNDFQFTGFEATPTATATATATPISTTQLPRTPSSAQNSQLTQIANTARPTPIALTGATNFQISEAPPTAIGNSPVYCNDNVAYLNKYTDVRLACQATCQSYLYSGDKSTDQALCLQSCASEHAIQFGLAQQRCTIETIVGNDGGTYQNGAFYYRNSTTEQNHIVETLASVRSLSQIDSCSSPAAYLQRWPDVGQACASSCASNLGQGLEGITSSLLCRSQCAQFHIDQFAVAEQRCSPQPTTAPIAEAVLSTTARDRASESLAAAINQIQQARNPSSCSSISSISYLATWPDVSAASRAACPIEESNTYGTCRQAFAEAHKSAYGVTEQRCL